MMLNTITAITLCLGCATAYRSSYTDQKLAANRYLVHVEVNRYTSMGTAVSYAYARAAEICPHGFNVIDSATDKNYRGSYAIRGSYVTTVRDISEPEMVLMFECQQTAIDKRQEFVRDLAARTGDKIWLGGGDSKTTLIWVMRACTDGFLAGLSEGSLAQMRDLGFRAITCSVDGVTVTATRALTELN